MSYIPKFFFRQRRPARRQVKPLLPKALDLKMHMFNKPFAWHREHSPFGFYCMFFGTMKSIHGLMFFS